MQAISNFLKAFKWTVVTLVTFLPQIIRFTFRQIGHLLHTVNQRLRVSITFKTTVTYTLIFSTLLIFLSTLLTGSFAVFLLYKAQLEGQKEVAHIDAMVSSSNSLPAERIEAWAGIEEVGVSLYDQRSQLLFTTLYSKPSTEQSTRIQLTPNLWMDDYLHYESPVNLNNGVARIEVTKNLTEYAQYLAALVTFLAVAFLLAITLTIFIGSRVSRKMLKPIYNMTSTARSISVGDLNTRLDVVDSHDELKELALTFNGMLDRIQTSVEQQSVFVSDASHELRTPIAVIQGYADMIHRWGKDDRAVLEEAIDAIKGESDFMKELVEKLLFLASADKKDLALRTSRWDLHELIEEVVKETKLIDANHHIVSDRNDAMMIYADRTLVKQALRILVDNSIKYTPVNGSIKLNSHKRGIDGLVTIEDTGIGIPAEDLPYIFNRFYKSDKTRTRNTGAGLGLSIAKLIIEKHHGSITVESQPGQGTKFTIRLPEHS